MAEEHLCTQIWAFLLLRKDQVPPLRTEFYLLRFLALLLLVLFRFEELPDESLPTGLLDAGENISSTLNEDPSRLSGVKWTSMVEAVRPVLSS